MKGVLYHVPSGNLNRSTLAIGLEDYWKISETTKKMAHFQGRTVNLPEAISQEKPSDHPLVDLPHVPTWSDMSDRIT